MNISRGKSCDSLRNRLAPGALLSFCVSECPVSWFWYKYGEKMDIDAAADQLTGLK